MISFTIPGKPIAKKRPKFARMGGFVKTYTPKETLNYESEVRLYFNLSKPKQFVPFDGAVAMKVCAYFPIPKSTTKKMRALMETEKYPHIKKPDQDNISKIISDALNKVAYRDDSQVSDAIVRKRYSKVPRVEVFIKPIFLENNDKISIPQKQKVSQLAGSK